MLLSRCRFKSVQVLLLVHSIHTYVLITANIEDVKKIARKIVPDSFAHRIADFITRVSEQTLTLSTEISEENSENAQLPKEDIDTHNVLRQKGNSSNRLRFEKQQRLNESKSIKPNDKQGSVYDTLIETRAKKESVEKDAKSTNEEHEEPEVKESSNEYDKHHKHTSRVTENQKKQNTKDLIRTTMMFESSEERDLEKEDQNEQPKAEPKPKDTSAKKNQNKTRDRLTSRLHQVKSHSDRPTSPQPIKQKKRENHSKRKPTMQTKNQTVNRGDKIKDNYKNEKESKKIDQKRYPLHKTQKKDKDKMNDESNILSNEQYHEHTQNKESTSKSIPKVFQLSREIVRNQDYNGISRIKKGLDGIKGKKLNSANNDFQENTNSSQEFAHTTSKYSKIKNGDHRNDQHKNKINNRSTTKKQRNKQGIKLNTGNKYEDDYKHNIHKMQDTDRKDKDDTDGQYKNSIDAQNIKNKEKKETEHNQETKNNDDSEEIHDTDSKDKDEPDGKYKNSSDVQKIKNKEKKHTKQNQETKNNHDSEEMHDTDSKDKDETDGQYKHSIDTQKKKNREKKESTPIQETKNNHDSEDSMEIKNKLVELVKKDHTNNEKRGKGVKQVKHNTKATKKKQSISKHQEYDDDTHSNQHFRADEKHNRYIIDLTRFNDDNGDDIRKTFDIVQDNEHKTTSKLYKIRVIPFFESQNGRLSDNDTTSISEELQYSDIISYEDEEHNKSKVDDGKQGNNESHRSDDIKFRINKTNPNNLTNIKGADNKKNPQDLERTLVPVSKQNMTTKEPEKQTSDGLKRTEKLAPKNPYLTHNKKKDQESAVTPRITFQDFSLAAPVDGDGLISWSDYLTLAQNPVKLQ